MRHIHYSRIVPAVFLLCLCLFSVGFADPDAADWYSKGMASFRQGLYGDAVELFSNAISLDPVYQPAYFQRGTAYLRLGEYDLAIEDLTTAIVLKPDDSQAFYNRGQAYMRDGDYGSAVSDFSQTIGIQPGRDDAYYERGKAYEKLGLYNNARKDLTRACNMGNDIACSTYDNFELRMLYHEYNAP